MVFIWRLVSLGYWERCNIFHSLNLLYSHIFHETVFLERDSVGEREKFSHSVISLSVTFLFSVSSIKCTSRDKIPICFRTNYYISLSLHHYIMKNRFLSSLSCVTQNLIVTTVCLLRLAQLTTIVLHHVSLYLFSPCMSNVQDYWIRYRKEKSSTKFNAMSIKVHGAGRKLWAENMELSKGANVTWIFHSFKSRFSSGERKKSYFT